MQVHRPLPPGPVATLLPPIRGCVLWGLIFCLLSVLLAKNACAAEPSIEDVVFRAKWDGSEQRYVRVLPADFDEKEAHDLIVAFHGHGSDRWQIVRQPRGECRGTREVAARHRMILISPDYRAKTSWMGPAAKADMLQILEEVKRAFRIRRTLIAGGSMGGTASLTFAALHPELVDGVVSLNGTANLVEYSRFLDAIAASYGGDKQAKPEEYRRRSAELWPERLTMPLACTVGGRDTIVPPDSVRRLTARLKQDQRSVLLIDRPEGGHDTNLEDTIAAYEFVIRQWRRAETEAK